MKDNLITCKRCGGNAAYETFITKEHKSWFCFGCGFTSNSLMIEGSQLVKSNDESSPELVKDLKYKDSDGYIWYPSNLSIPEKGIVFIDGTSKNNWKWAFAPSIKLTTEEINSGKYPKGNEFKINYSKVKHFEQSDFMDACDELGLFGKLK